MVFVSENSFKMSYSATKSKKTGRLILLGFYIAYWVIYTIGILGVPEEANRQLVGSTIVTMLWTTALFGAIWQGHNWARYIFLGLLVVTILFSVPMFAAVESLGFHLPPAMWLLILFHIAVFFTLIYSSSIRALVRK